MSSHTVNDVRADDSSDIQGEPQRQWRNNLINRLLAPSSSPPSLPQATPKQPLAPSHPDDLPSMPSTWRSSIYATIFSILHNHLSSVDWDFHSRGLWPQLYSCDDPQVTLIAGQILKIFMTHIFTPCRMLSSFYSLRSSAYCRQVITDTILPLFERNPSTTCTNCTATIVRETFANHLLCQFICQLSSSLQSTVGQGLPSQSVCTMPAPLFTESFDMSNVAQLVTSFDAWASCHFHRHVPDTTVSLLPDDFVTHCSTLMSRNDLSIAEVAVFQGIPLGPHVGNFASIPVQRRASRGNPSVQFVISSYTFNDPLPVPSSSVSQQQPPLGRGRRRSRSRSRRRQSSTGSKASTPTSSSASASAPSSTTETTPSPSADVTDPLQPTTAPYTCTRFDEHPAAASVTATDPFFTSAGTRASDVTLAMDPYAIVDHLSWQQCVGGQDSHFFEITNLPSKLHGFWAEGVQLLCSDVADVLDQHKVLTESNDDMDHQLQRRLKMFFLFWFLILRKPPSSTSPNSKRTNQLIKARLSAWVNRDWKSLFDKYEEDVILVQSQSSTPSSSSASQQSGNIRECFKALSAGKINKATSSLLSLGTSNPSNPAIQAQLDSKHPKQKFPSVLPPMNNSPMNKLLSPLIFFVIPSKILAARLLLV